jgi:hypothetical protein
MKTVRSAPMMPENMRWNPDSGDHYTRFAAGPLSAYSQYSNEFQDSLPNSWLNKLRGDLNSEPIKNLSHLLKNKNLTSEQVAESLKTLGFSNQISESKDTQQAIATLRDQIKSVGSGNNQNFRNFKEEINTGIIDYLKANGVSVPDSKSLNGHSIDKIVSPEIQKKLFPGFDDYLKKTNPDLWTKKQYSDFLSGTRVSTWGPVYGRMMQASQGFQNAGKAVGLGVAGAGLGALGVYAYNKWKDKKREEEAERIEKENKAKQVALAA